MASSAKVEHIAEYANELEGKINMLYDAIDTDPYFSKLDEKTQEEIERELVEDIVDKGSWLMKTVKKEFVKNSVISTGGLELEPIELSDEKYTEIKKTLREEIGNIESNRFDIEEELVERAAFRLIGKSYIKPGKERDELFLSDEELYADFSDAFYEASAANTKWKREQGIKDTDVSEQMKYLFSSTPELQPEIEVPEVVAEEEKEEKPSWVSRHKKLIGLGIVGLLGGAAGYAWYRNWQSDNKPQLSHKERFIRFANENGFTNSTAKGFYNEYMQLAQTYFPEHNSTLLPPLSVYAQNATLLNQLYKGAMNDPQITIDRQALVPKISELILNLNLADKSLTKPTIHAVGNLTVAHEQLGLPEQSKTTQWLLTNATQSPEGKYLVDYSPIVFKSVNSSDVYITPNPAREFWLTTELLKYIQQSDFNITAHPEMLQGINGKIITNAFCLFDHPYGIAYHSKDITPSNSSVSDLVALQWDLYSQFAPQRNGSALLYNRDFPWYDGAALREIYKDDPNAMRAALFKLFYLPAGTYSIKDQKFVPGIEGTKISLLDAYDEYQNILKLYPNGTVYAWGRNRDIRDFYYSWLVDRGGNNTDGSPRLYNTVKQFVGLNGNELLKVMEEADKQGISFARATDNYTGFGQYLTKNWKYWDLVRFVTGYERWNPKAGLEMDGIYYIIPQVLRMAGFPVYHINIEPTPLGAAGSEWAVCLPPYVVKGIHNQFPDKSILLGPGYTFGLYSCGDGLIKERGVANDVNYTPIENGILRAGEWYGDKGAYLMKRN